MATNVSALVADMLRFASLLKLVARPGPAVALDFEELAAKIRDRPSTRALKEEREWLFMMLERTGNNSIFDRYVVVNGEPNTELSREYLALAGRLRHFGNPRRIGFNPFRLKPFS